MKLQGADGAEVLGAVEELETLQKRFHATMDDKKCCLQCTGRVRVFSLDSHELQDDLDWWTEHATHTGAYCVRVFYSPSKLAREHKSKVAS